MHPGLHISKEKARSDKRIPFEKRPNKLTIFLAYLCGYVAFVVTYGDGRMRTKHRCVDVHFTNWSERIFFFRKCCVSSSSTFVMNYFLMSIGKRILYQKDQRMMAGAGPVINIFRSHNYYYFDFVNPQCIFTISLLV